MPPDRGGGKAIPAGIIGGDAGRAGKSGSGGGGLPALDECTNCIDNSCMFEWDDAKSASNLLKHRISFEEAVLIFEGPTLSWPDDRRNYGESRAVTIGLIRSVVAVAVVHTDRNGHIRVISARLANRKERRIYDEHFGQAPR